MRIHGLKRLHYWIVSIILDILLLYIQFIILWFLTYIVDYTGTPLYINNALFIYMLQYLTVAVIIIKILSINFSVAFNSMTFLPFFVSILQNMVFPFTTSEAISDGVFIAFNVVSPFFTYFTETISTAMR